jgi:deoxyxylulose-5-phosphate synthase
MQISSSPVVYLPTIEPLSKKTQNKIVNLLKRQEKCITFEENSEIGSCADKIFDIASKHGISIRMKKIGIPRKFCENYGKPNEHRKSLGISYENVLEKINEL